MQADKGTCKIHTGNRMRIAVIAANGRSGSEFVKLALEAGHTVHAGTRHESHLTPHPNLTVVRCDATNTGELRRLLANQEAVTSFIGHSKGSPSDVQTVAMQNVIRNMDELGISRVVSLTGTGVRFPGDTISLIDRILNFGISVIDPARINDGKNHVERLRESGLDWTVIRVLKLQNVRPQPFTLRLHGPTKWYVSRQEVAQAVLQVLEEHSFRQQAPIIGKV
jgi:putative NADH-flavin reductase